MKIGDQLKFDYTGDVQEVALPAGNYQFECWGAGVEESDVKMLGGKGGYSKGTITLIENTLLYCYVGGKGTRVSVNIVEGGWNGGGGSNTINGSVGGGGTDVRLTDGEWNLKEGFLSRIIVAGGGGGGGWNNSSTSQIGGDGGGTEGISGGAKYDGQFAVGLGGTQTEGGKINGTAANSGISTEGTFGIGGKGRGSSSGGGGGGGGWFGGGGGAISPGGGGSGYILTSDSYKPENYTPTEKYHMTDTILISGNLEQPSPNGGTQIGQEGNGYCIITYLGGSINAKCKINGQINQVNDMKVKVNGSWKNVTKALTKINGIWK